MTLVWVLVRPSPSFSCIEMKPTEGAITWSPVTSEASVVVCHIVSRLGAFPLPIFLGSVEKFLSSWYGRNLLPWASWVFSVVDFGPKRLGTSPYSLKFSLIWMTHSPAILNKEVQLYLIIFMWHNDLQWQKIKTTWWRERLSSRHSKQQQEVEKQPLNDREFWKNVQGIQCFILTWLLNIQN